MAAINPILEEESGVGFHLLGMYPRPCPNLSNPTPIPGMSFSPDIEIENSEYLKSLLKGYPYYYINKGSICTDITITSAQNDVYERFTLGLKVTKKRVKSRITVNGAYCQDELIGEDLIDIIKMRALHIFKKGGTYFKMELGGNKFTSLKLTLDSFATSCDCVEDNCVQCLKHETRTFTRFESILMKFIRRFKCEVDYILDDYRNPPPSQCSVCLDPYDEVEDWFRNSVNGKGCGHYMCYDCAFKITNAAVGLGKCPLCRSDLPYSLVN